jgi:hypothetical protein
MKNLILIILTVYVYSQTYNIEANDFTNKKVNFKSINFNNDTNFLEVNISSYLSKPITRIKLLLNLNF